MLAREEELELILPELAPLTKDHWDESHAFRTAPYNPNWQGMLKFNRLGLFKVVTLRTSKGKLIGYLSFFLTVSSHTSEACANLDSFFVSKDWRFGRSAFLLLTEAERLFRSLNLTSIFTSNPLTASPALNKLMTKFGYAPVSTVFHKSLGG